MARRPSSTQAETAVRRRSGVRTLSRERIAAAALEIAEREGLDAVSMRRLARELAVGPMTLYRYFRSKDELIDAAVDAAAQEVEVNVGGGPWKQELRKLMRAVRETLERHPVGIRLRLTRPILSHGALRITEAGMEILAGAGFDRAGAARAYRALFVYTFGFASFGSPDHPEDIKRHTQAALIALPPDEYPMLSAAASEAAETMAGEAQFEFGLDRLLDGLEAELQRERPARSR